MGHLDFPLLGPVNPVFSQETAMALSLIVLYLAWMQICALEGFPTCANEIRQGPSDTGQTGTE